MTSGSAWADDAVWWQLYPLGFTGAPKEQPAVPEPPGRPRLDRIVGWLDYAAELGCTGLLLGPVFASRTHGYDTEDHFRIDPRLGDDAAFDRLVTQAGRRGLRILLDGVFNHVGRGFAQFVAAERDGPSSPAARWFRPQAGPDGAPDGTVEYATFEGHHGLVALNHDEPAVDDHVGKVLRHWLDRGASGWRLDAAYAVPPEFWARVLPGIRRDHPDAWFVAEMIHGDRVDYVRRSGLDSVTQYELWKAIWSSLNDGNFFELAWALDRHDRLLDHFLPQTFVGNHDVTRLATRLSDDRHLGHALAVLLAVGGVPSVYSGDEQAFRGLKEDRVGGDDAVRPAFPDRPADLAPYGLATHRMHQQLIRLRRERPGQATARTTVEHLTNTSIALRAQPADGSGSALLVLLNVRDEPYRFPLDPQFELRPDGDPLLVPAHGWAVHAVRAATVPMIVPVAGGGRP